MPQSNPMKPLYRRLSEVGLSRDFVKKTALPSWWEDEIASNPAGYAQGLLPRMERCWTTSLMTPVWMWKSNRPMRSPRSF